MLRTLYRVCTYLLVALGVAHVAFTFHDYDEFTLAALWFFGAGVGIVFAGFLNLIRLGEGGRASITRLLCLAANLTLVALFVAALALMRQPQVFLGLALSLVLTLGSLLADRGR